MSPPSLPRPVGRQREVLYLPPTGHTVVLGTAGSGKTTLAILRSLYLSDPNTDHGGKTLLVGHLQQVSRHLYETSGRRSAARHLGRKLPPLCAGYLSHRGKLPWASIGKPQ